MDDSVIQNIILERTNDAQKISMSKLRSNLVWHMMDTVDLTVPYVVLIDETPPTIILVREDGRYAYGQFYEKLFTVSLDVAKHLIREYITLKNFK